MLRNTLSNIRKVCALSFIPRLWRGHIIKSTKFQKLPSHVTTASKSSKSSDTEKCDKCKRIIDYAFGNGEYPADDIKGFKSPLDSELSHIVTPQVHKRPPNPEKILDKVKGKENEKVKEPLTDSRIITAKENTKLEEIPNIIKKISVAEATVRATTTKHNEEELVQKIETIDEPPLVTTACTPEDDLHKNTPKVLTGKPVTVSPKSPKPLDTRTSIRVMRNLLSKSAESIKRKGNQTLVNIETKKPETAKEKTENDQLLKDIEKFGVAQPLARSIESPPNIKENMNESKKLGFTQPEHTKKQTSDFSGKVFSSKKASKNYSKVENTDLAPSEHKEKKVHEWWEDQKDIDFGTARHPQTFKSFNSVSPSEYILNRNNDNISPTPLPLRSQDNTQANKRTVINITPALAKQTPTDESEINKRIQPMEPMKEITSNIYSFPSERIFMDSTTSEELKQRALDRLYHTNLSPELPGYDNVMDTNKNLKLEHTISPVDSVHLESYGKESTYTEPEPLKVSTDFRELENRPKIIEIGAGNPEQWASPRQTIRDPSSAEQCTSPGQTVQDSSSAGQWATPGQTVRDPSSAEQCTSPGQTVQDSSSTVQWASPGQTVRDSSSAGQSDSIGHTVRDANSYPHVSGQQYQGLPANWLGAQDTSTWDKKRIESWKQQQQEWLATQKQLERARWTWSTNSNQTNPEISNEINTGDSKQGPKPPSLHTTTAQYIEKIKPLGSGTETIPKVVKQRTPNAENSKMKLESIAEVTEKTSRKVTEMSTKQSQGLEKIGEKTNAKIQEKPNKPTLISAETVLEAGSTSSAVLHPEENVIDRPKSKVDVTETLHEAKDTITISSFKTEIKKFLSSYQKTIPPGIRVVPTYLV